MKKAGIVLEGGASRGVFTAGVLDYLMEIDFYFPYVIGVSAGCCNGIDYAAKQPGRTKQCMIVTEKEKSYWGIGKMLKKKSIFDMDMIFDKYPNEFYPFDYDTYFRSEVECETVVTNCLTGKAEYMDERFDRERLMKISRASSSLPLVSPMVEIDGIPYLDGGLADSIPISHTLRKGYKKCVVVLTRNHGYRKGMSKKTRGLYIAAYKKYPELVKTICYRPMVYNRQMELVEKLEEAGRIFVIRPEVPAISRLERKEPVLTEFYNHGYEVMKNNLEKMMEYLSV